MAGSARAILRLLYRWGLWLRMVESLTWGPWGAACGAATGMLVALMARVWPLMLTRWLIALSGTLTLVGFAIGTVTPWLRPRSPLRLAYIFDRRLGLAERLTTALELSAGRIKTTREMAHAQISDALQAARSIDIQALLPLRASRRALVAFGLMVFALVLLFWLPNPQDLVLLQRAALRKTIEAQRERLEAIRQEAAQAEGLSDADREAILQALDQALSALDKRRTPQEAVAVLSDAERKLAELRDPGTARLQTGMERAAAEMADSPLTSAISEALARGDYREAARALAAYSGTEGRPLTREEELELARELEQAAQTLGDADRELAQELREAAEAIRRGDIARARQAIRQAARQMDTSGERIARESTVEKTLSGLQDSRLQIAEKSGLQPATAEVTSGRTGQRSGTEEAGGSAQGGAGEAQQTGTSQGQPGHREDTGSSAPYDEVYVPYRIGEGGVEMPLGREGEGEPVARTGTIPPPQTGQAGVPYRQVYVEYATRAGAALESSYIPLGMKQYVRDYFSALEP